MIATQEAALLEALRDVEDPEIPISVVDMGLIVDLKCSGDSVAIKITFTAMGCPAMDMIIEDVRERLLQEPGVRDVDVQIVWEPVWTAARLTDDGRAAMREWGISV